MTCFVEQSQNQGTMDTRIGKWIVALPKASPQGEWEKKIFVYFAYSHLEHRLKASTKWPQNLGYTLAIFKVMTAPPKPISEATKNIVLQGIIQQSIKTILLYESEWYPHIKRNKEIFSISETFMIRVFVFILTWIIPSLILSNMVLSEFRSLFLWHFFSYVHLLSAQH